MNSTIVRSLSGIVFITIMLAGVLYNAYSYLVLFGVINVVCLWEYYKISQPGISKANIVSLVILGVGIYILSFYFGNRMFGSYSSVLILIIFLYFLYTLYTMGSAVYRSLPTGIMYITVPLSLLNQLVLSGGTYSYVFVLFILMIIWTSDTMAYVCGLLLGKNKLFESISPKKTWEGAIGGILFSGGLGFFVPTFLEIGLSPISSMLLAAVISIAGIYGDLFESKLKRSFGVKDSGNIMPGHGGLLDRFDAFLFVIPFVVFYLQYVRF